MASDGTAEAKSEGHVHDATEADFDERVVARSRAVPVVVDFWAEWCAPCRALGPLLEKEVAALGGRVELVKVDTDANPNLSASHRVRGIPAVMAYRDGRVVDEFVGAQPAAVVREFLARLVPSPAKALLLSALAARGRGDAAEAERAARAILDAPPSEVASPPAKSDVVDEAALLLARTLLETGRAAEIDPVLARVDPRSEASDRAESIRALAAFAAEAKQSASAAEAAAQAQSSIARDADDLAARYRLAAALVASGRLTAALEPLFAIVERSRKFRDDAALTTMRALFDYLGADDEVVREYRRRLQILT